MGKKLRLIFLGTNGWFSTKAGLTVCALLETPERYIVLDAGEGLQHLGKYAKDLNKPVDLYLSHFHLDHTIGLHILPLFRYRKQFRIFVQKGGKKSLEGLLKHPYTATQKELWLKLSIHELHQGENDVGGDYLVFAAPLKHADPCWGYRFEIGAEKEKRKKTVAYCTDTGPCPSFEKLAAGADALITECTLLPGMPSPAFWPHLSPDAAAKIARKAACRKLYLTHFDASRYPELKDRKKAQRAARKAFSNTVCATDGLSVLV